MNSRGLLCGAFFCVAVASSTYARVITVVPSRDATIHEHTAGSLADGKGVYLFVGQNAGGQFARRALLAFDFAGRIPPGSEIHSVSLTLHVSRTTAGPQRVMLHRVLAEWGEGASVADGGGGSAAAEGNATWLHRFYDDQAWANPGGDFATTADAEQQVDGVGFYTWGSTPEMVAAVQDWLDNPAARFGWMVVGAESESRTSKRFDSRENDSAVLRPMLTINFTPAGGCAEPLLADLDADCRVGFSDLAILASQWLADERRPRDAGTVDMAGVGEFSFDPQAIHTLRPDIFQPGSFSLFDVLVHLNATGAFEMNYHWAEDMNTHVIDTINGLEDWWYVAFYDGGWSEDNIYRMDHYPYKDKMTIRVMQIERDRIESVYEVYREEVLRRAQNGGKVVIPRVTIAGQSETLRFENVLVEPHNLRNDTFRDGVVTGIDVILSLGDQGLISYDLQWYDSIGSAGVVRSHWVQRINNDQASGFCGFVYEAGPSRFARSNHIHIPSDFRPLNSPEYALWYWIRLGPCD